MKIRGFSILAMITALMVSVIACQPTTDVATDESAGEPTTEMAMPGDGVTVRSATSAWSEEQFMAHVINLGFEELGYQTEDLQQADYAAIHLAVGSGDLEYSPSFYEPGYQESFNNAGGEEKIERLGFIIPDGGQAGYAIDVKTANEYNIRNFEQLQDSELAQLFDIDNDGKANLAGCDPGWKCSSLIAHHLEVYGLRDTVEQDSGNYTALLADVMVRYEAEQPILLYAYSPHWLLSVLEVGEDIQWLEVPFTSLIEDMAALTVDDTTTNGRNLGIPVSRNRVIANREFLQENPAARQWLEIVQIPAADMNQESLRIRDGENSPEDIRHHAEEWVAANREQVDEWLEEARQAAS